MKASKKILIVLIAIAVLVIGVFVAGSVWASSRHLTIEEVYQCLNNTMAKQTQRFEEEYDCEGTTFTIDTTNVKIERQPEFTLEGLKPSNPYLRVGHISGEILVVVDAPGLYPHLEKESFTFEDIQTLDKMQKAFDPNENDYIKYGYWEFDDYNCYVEIEEIILLDSKGNQYEVMNYSQCDLIYKNGEVIYEQEYRTSSTSSSTSSSGDKCPWCNGTGGVRYNYGSSDLEAILSGHDPYVYGTCGSCGGTGRAK